MTTPPDPRPLEVRVRRIHRRDLNRAWEFLKLVFRDVNRETVEYQRPRSKARFCDIYDEEGTEQLLFEVGAQIVGYAECTFDTGGKGSWINPRYFEKREMRPIFVEELAVHPEFQGKGVGNFMLEQIHHLARLRGCTHVVLEVAENNTDALRWYRKRNFYKLDAAIFLAQRVATEPDLLPPRRLRDKQARARILRKTTASAPRGKQRAKTEEPNMAKPGAAHGNGKRPDA
jgi:ribosomal protein S18 acetylase RimI-like enzyme